MNISNNEIINKLTDGNIKDFKNILNIIHVISMLDVPEFKNIK